MTVILDQFLQTLRESGLFSAQEIDAFLDSLPPEERPRTSKELAKLLVKRRKLTKFQAHAIYQGKTAGLVVGNYLVQKKLGQGGMGTVYKALHTKLDKFVALKILPAAAMQDAELVARFEREMKAVGKLEHPNIVRAMDAGCHEGTHFLVMEFIDGMDLTQIVKRCGPLPIADACEVIHQAALGLRHADEHALVHRDIKPSNLMLNSAGEVKILDLGLARLHTERMAGAEAADQGRALGTVDYMAPEQARDYHFVDIRADIYSLGCTFYRLLTGQSPFTGPQYQNNLDKVMAHASQPFPAIQQTRPDVPKELAAVLERMVAKDREARYRTPRQLAVDLKPFCPGCDLAGLLIHARKRAKAGTRFRTSPADNSSSEPTAEDEWETFEQMLGDLAAPSPLARQPSRPKVRPTARVQALLRRNPLYAWIVGSCAAAALLLAVVIYVITGKGTVKIELSNPTAKVQVRIDGNQIDIARLKEPLRLSVGEHALQVTSGEFKTFSQSFAIRRGTREVVFVKLAPKADRRNEFPLLPRLD